MADSLTFNTSTTFINTSPNTIISWPNLTATNTTWQNGQCIEHLTGDDVEFADGSTATSCVLCGIRIRLQQVPGGVNSLKIRQLLEQLAAKEPDEELVAEYAELRLILQAEREALELAESMLQPIELLLAKRLLS